MAQMVYPEELLNSGILFHGPIDLRLPDHKVAPFIREAEERFLKPYMGEAYDEYVDARDHSIRANYNPAAGPLVDVFADPDKEEVFKDCILPLMGAAVYYLAIPTLHLTAGGEGITIPGDEQPAGKQEVATLRQVLFQRLLWLARSLNKKLHPDDCDRMTRVNWLGAIFPD